nr:uncharacterized protein LOC129273245 [Lytechinus pictus]
MSLSERARAFSIDAILSSTKSPEKVDNDNVDAYRPTFHPGVLKADDVTHDTDYERRYEEDYNPTGFEFNSDIHFQPRMSLWRGRKASVSSSTSTLNSASSTTDVNFGSSHSIRRSSDEADGAFPGTPFGSRLGSLAVSDDSLNYEDPMIVGDIDDDAHPISSTVNGITITLAQSSLWRRFHECETEMIINRSGRRMFPCFAVTLSGLQPDALYRISVSITSENRSRYKFINGKWLAVGKADPEVPNEPYEHPLSPNRGLFWESNVVSFAKLKITNNKDTKAKNQIVLHSMHTYTPRLFIERLSDEPSPNNSKGERDLTSGPSSSSHSTSTSSPSTWMHMQTSDSSSNDTASTSTGVRHPAGSMSSPMTRSPSHDHRLEEKTCISFPETSFIAVTAYQNDQITQLKIQNNPFAKAFRDAEVAAMLQGSPMFPVEHHLLADYRERGAFSSTHSLNGHMIGKRRIGLPVNMQRLIPHLGVVPGHHQPPPMARSMANMRAETNDSPNPNLLGHDLNWKVSSATNLAGRVNEGAIHESCGFLPSLSLSQRANSDVELSAKANASRNQSLISSFPFGGLGMGSDGGFRKRALSNLADNGRESDKWMLRNSLIDAAKKHRGSQPIIYPSQSRFSDKEQTTKLYKSLPWFLDSPQIIVSDTAKAEGQETPSMPSAEAKPVPSSFDDKMSTDDRNTKRNSAGKLDIGDIPNAEESGGSSGKLMVPPNQSSLTPNQRYHLVMNRGDLTRRVTIHTTDSFRSRIRDSPVMKPRRSLDLAKMPASLYHFRGSSHSPRLGKRDSVLGTEYTGSCGSLNEETPEDPMEPHH